ncbi:MAG: hypothetical protein ACRBCS_08080 [Cellvibrionaceae bacterium]
MKIIFLIGTIICSLNSFANDEVAKLTIETRSVEMSYNIAGDFLSIEVKNDELNGLYLPVFTKIELGERDKLYLQSAFKSIFNNVGVKSADGFDGSTWCIIIGGLDKCLWSPKAESESDAEKELYYLGVYLWDLSGFQMPSEKPYIVVNGIAIRRAY